MRYKLLAPVRTDFSIVSEAPIREPDRYAAFWNERADRKRELHALLPDRLALSSGLDEIRFAHASTYRRSPFNRYQSLESDALERPIHVLEIQLDRSTFAADASSDSSSPQAKPERHVEQLIWRVFDHGISLLEVDIHLGNFLHAVPREQVPAVLTELQQTGVRMGERLARRCADTLLQPLFDWLQAAPDSAAYIEPDAATRGHDANGTVLWVTRTLIFEKGDDPNREAIVRHWLKDAAPAEEEKDDAKPAEDKETLIDRIVRNEEEHLTRWLNYLFREGSYSTDSTDDVDQEEPSNLARPFCDAWEAMLYAQFYYGALDIVDLHLTRILAQSLARDSSLQVDQLKALLEQNIRKANLLLLQFHDSAKYYKRTVKSELDDILDYWDFESVLIKPVQEKITLCRERLTLLHQKEAARSAIYTDVILLGVAIHASGGVASGLGTLLVVPIAGAGTLLAAAAGAFVVGNPALGDSAWRWGFAIGALPALLTVWVRWKLKEPEQWQQARQRASEDASQRTGRVSELFNSANLRNTLIAVGLSSPCCGMPNKMPWRLSRSRPMPPRRSDKRPWTSTGQKSRRRKC